MPVDLAAIARQQNGVEQVHVAMAGGALIKAAGRPKPKHWPDVTTHEHVV